MAGQDLEILRGTLDLIILKTLSWGPMHGLGVVRWIEDVTHEQILVEEGALYPALHRLEEKGWLSATWGLTEAGRRAKYYALKPAGRQQLAAQAKRWERYAMAMDRILTAQAAR